MSDKKDDIQSVLSELQKVLSDLTAADGGNAPNPVPVSPAAPPVNVEVPRVVIPPVAVESPPISIGMPAMQVSAQPVATPAPSHEELSEFLPKAAPLITIEAPVEKPAEKKEEVIPEPPHPVWQDASPATPAPSHEELSEFLPKAAPPVTLEAPVEKPAEKKEEVIPEPPHPVWQPPAADVSTAAPAPISAEAVPPRAEEPEKTVPVATVTAMEPPPAAASITSAPIPAGAVPEAPVAAPTSTGAAAFPEELPEDIPENAVVVEYALYYPPKEPGSRDLFRKNINEVIKKTSKKPFFARKLFDQPLDAFSAGWEAVIGECRAGKVQAVFVIYAEKFDTFEIKNKFVEAGIFFQGVPVSQLERRITYVDLVIELMLTKKDA